MSEIFGEGPFYEISFPKVKLEGDTNIAAKIVCKQCGAMIPLKGTKKRTIRSAEGLRCKKCPRAYFFAACGKCKSLIGLDDIQLKKMDSGGTEPCPNCRASLIWPLPPGPVM